MRSPEEDLRVRRTRKALRNALIQLILKKGYDAITIQDIVDEAETARVTFYRHYKDKDELLKTCLDDVYAALITRLTRVSLDDLKIEQPPILLFYEQVEENINLYRAIFNSQICFAAQTQIRDHLMQLIQSEIKTLLPHQKFPVPLKLIALHAAVAELGLVMWWIEHPDEYSTVYLAKVSHWLNLGSILNTLGIANQIPLSVPQQ